MFFHCLEQWSPDLWIPRSATASIKPATTQPLNDKYPHDKTKSQLTPHAVAQTATIKLRQQELST